MLDENAIEKRIEQLIDERIEFLVQQAIGEGLERRIDDIIDERIDEILAQEAQEQPQTFSKLSSRSDLAKSSNRGLKSGSDLCVIRRRLRNRKRRLEIL
ncbi:hypothetical protein MY1884_001587 [Beauveria asiatica]